MAEPPQLFSQVASHLSFTVPQAQAAHPDLCPVHFGQSVSLVGKSTSRAYPLTSPARLFLTSLLALQLDQHPHFDNQLIVTPKYSLPSLPLSLPPWLSPNMNIGKGTNMTIGRMNNVCSLKFNRPIHSSSTRNLSPVAFQRLGLLRMYRAFIQRTLTSQLCLWIKICVTYTTMEAYFSQ